MNNRKLFLVGKKGIPYPCNSQIKSNFQTVIKNHIDDLVELARYAIFDMLADSWDGDDYKTYIKNNFEIENQENTLEIVKKIKDDIDSLFEIITINQSGGITIYVSDVLERVWEVSFETDKNISEWQPYCIEGWFNKNDFV